MNSTNPFQIPACLLRSALQLRRRERFRRGVVVVVAAIVTLLVILLIEGCMSEHAKTPSSTVPAVTGQQPAAAPVEAPKPAVTPTPARHVTAPAITPVMAVKAVAPVSVRPGEVYTVKSGDTLSRIARQHHTTVKALKSANGLDTDIIAVGASLKLPAA
jgi:LysM repeat protein